MSGAVAFLLSKTGQRVMITGLVVLVLLATVARCYVWKRTSERTVAIMVSICKSSLYDFSTVEAAEFVATCRGEVERLARVERELRDQSLKAALALIAEREARARTDAALAVALARRTAKAVAHMEAVEDGVEEDQVDGDWACAVNELGGLRASGCATAP